MNRKAWIFLIVMYFLSLCIPFIYMVFLYPWGEDIEREKVRLINTIHSKQGALETLAYEISTCPDTSYFANYSVQSREFDVVRVRNDTTDILSPSLHTSHCLEKALELAATMGVSVLNNKRNRFFRIDFPGSQFWDLSLYIPKQKSDTEQNVKEVEGMQKISSRLYMNLTRTEGTLYLK